ncbi:alanine racemase [Mycolicibacterium neoaurum]|uniref:alanine racemase n=1 Tax=Mycolicibacterium neoaurum TaxID=1795 RepID=UPI002673E692|nr:alanine racemase [Mycolicibacterium neoaurum]MDO3399915.1 alanine racemase [Mycolicibacterium neoaurum]
MTPMPIRLQPRLSEPIRTVLDDADLLDQLVYALGSPLNLVLPGRILHNADAFAEVLAQRAVRGHVHYAHKANRSAGLVRQLAHGSAHRIDVASVGELRNALAGGFGPDRIIATGPKNAAFLGLCATLGITVVIDSLAELQQLGVLRRDTPGQPVLIRLSGFAGTAGAGAGAVRLSRSSRFGIAMADLPDVFELLAGCDGTLVLRGFAYHLDTIDIGEKVAAFDGCLSALEQSRDRGHLADVVDVGGGFGVDYLAVPQEWDNFTSALGEAVLGRRPPITWQGTGYGLRAEAGRLRGSLNLYPASRPLAGPDYLATILDSRSAVGATFATALSESLVELWVEPGRALLDQVGVVAARVLEVRRHGPGEVFVRVDLNARDVSCEEHGVQMDPVLVPVGPGERSQGEGYILGNLCLEADLVTRRRIHFPRLPQVGDVLAWANTAGYFMDFSADHALSQPVARTVTITGDRRWQLDEEFLPRTQVKEYV